MVDFEGIARDTLGKLAGTPLLVEFAPLCFSASAAYYDAGQNTRKPSAKEYL